MIRSIEDKDFVRIVAAPRDENDILAENWERLSAWAPPNGWIYIEYLDVLDLLSRIADLQVADAQQVAEIEIVAHGNPGVCNDLVLGNVAVAAESLRRIAGIGDTTAVYLSGCNTGVEFNGECIARSFAAAFKAPVFGSRGYTSQARTRSERSVA